MGAPSKQEKLVVVAIGCIGRCLTVYLFFNGTINPELYGEPELLKIVQEETYDKIHGRITAKNLMTISQNPLSLAIKVSPFIIFSFRKYVYSYKLPDLHFTVQLFLENASIRE